MDRLRALIWILLPACTEPPPLYPTNAPPEIVDACTLTLRKCTACHDRDRIVDARFNAQEWRDTVEEMRRLPGSSISAAERDVILRCLLSRQPPSASVQSSCFLAVR